MPGSWSWGGGALIGWVGLISSISYPLRLEPLSLQVRSDFYPTLEMLGLALPSCSLLEMSEAGLV